MRNEQMDIIAGEEHILHMILIYECIGEFDRETNKKNIEIL